MASWKQNVRKVIPYTPGEQPKDTGIIKLNTNENPYPPSPVVQKALQALDAEQLRLYPDPAAEELTGALSRYYHVPEERIFVGVGSDDVLAMCFLTFFNGKKPVLFPDITYSFYDVWAELFRIPYDQVLLDDDFQIRPEDYARECGGIIFPNPNAPTGEILTLEAIESVLSHNPDVICIVDEAYVDFGAQSALPLLDKYENLVVVQTFSKSRSLAGLRIGYAFGSPDAVRCLQDVKYSYNSYTMNRPALRLGAEVLRDDAYFRETTQKIVETREWTKEQLRTLGFRMGDSQANFLFVTHPKVHAKELFDALREQKIIVRYFQKARIDNYLRITIGTPEQMRTLVDFLRGYPALAG